MWLGILLYNLWGNLLFPCIPDHDVKAIININLDQNVGSKYFDALKIYTFSISLT